MTKVRELVGAWQRPDGSFNGKIVGKTWTGARRSYLENHFLPVVGDRELDHNFGAPDIWDLHHHCRDAGLANTTTNKVAHGTLGPLLEWCEAKQLVPYGTKDRVLRSVKRLRADGEREGVALTWDERDHLIDSFDPYWRPHVGLLAYTGLRQGEACGVRQRDVHWSRHMIQIQRSRNRSEVTPTKQRRSQRPLAVVAAAIACISPLRNDDVPEAYVLPSKRGCPMHAGHFREMVWHPTCRRAGFPGLQMHDLRHTFATLCLESGELNIVQVAKLLGNTPLMVQERYEHVLVGNGLERAVRAPAPVRAVK